MGSNVSGRSVGGINGPGGRYVNGVYRPNVTENLVPKTDIAKRIFNVYKYNTPYPEEIKIFPPKDKPRITKSTPKPKPSPSSKMPKGPPTPKEGPKPKPTLKPIRPTPKPTTPNQIKLAQATRERIADAQTLRKAIESGTTNKSIPPKVVNFEKGEELNKIERINTYKPRIRGTGRGGGVGGPFGSRIR